MARKYRIHNAPNPPSLEQAARIGSNMAIVYSIGPCSHLRFDRDPVNGRLMDEFPIYFEDYPKISELRHSADAVWLEPLRQHVNSMCDRSTALGMTPAFHLYEPQLPLAFEQEYPETVGVYKRTTQEGIIDVHTCLNPDNPDIWTLLKSKYRELARDFPKIGLYVITTGDIAGTHWCMPNAKMSIADRLVNMVQSAYDGVREANSDAVVCFRLWWRNFPDELYRDGHRLISELTGLENATDLMNPVGKSHNDPATVLPAVFEKIPADVPIMYKSTRMDIHDNSPLTLAVGKYPKGRDEIIEISYENFNLKPWPWCKAKHIRKGLDAVAEHDLAGYVSLPINMGNNEQKNDPEAGNLGRMNTWILEELSKGDKRSDRELVTAWLEQEFEGPQPEVVVDALLDADVIADEGIQWGGGINHRIAFGSLHTTKLYWNFDGFIQPDFPSKIANPDADYLETHIKMKHDAHKRAVEHIGKLYAARPAMHPKLFEEIHGGYQIFADYISLRRDWVSYLLMQYGIEKGVFPPERKVLGRMSRYVETFIRNLVRLKDTPAGKRVMNQIGFPDKFPLT